MQGHDLSKGSVRRAVLNRSLQHPASIYPTTLGLLGGVGLVAFGASPIALGILAAGVCAGAGSLAFQYFIKGNAYAERFIAELRHRVAAQRERTLKDLRTDFDGLGDQRGSRQISQLQAKFNNFEDVLDRQLNTGEITHLRYLTIAEQVFLGGLDNLKAVALALRSISAIDPARIQRRLSELSQPEGGEDLRSERESLNARLALHTNQLEEADRLLAQNEAAMTHLDHVSARLASVRTTDGHANLDMEAAMDELRVLIDRADAYGR